MLMRFFKPFAIFLCNVRVNNVQFIQRAHNRVDVTDHGFVIIYSSFDMQMFDKLQEGVSFLDNIAEKAEG